MAYQNPYALPIDRSPYQKRAQILKRLGFSSYQEYLKSDLWASIREKTFAKHGKKCVRCGQDADQIHHAAYSYPALSGRDVRRLHPVCNGCHKQAEFFQCGERAGLRAANAFLQRKRNERGKAIRVFRGQRRKSAIAAQARWNVCRDNQKHADPTASKLCEGVG